jgi:hypothetical protein
MKWQYCVVTYTAEALEHELNRLGAEEWEVVGTNFDRIEIRPAVGRHVLHVVQVTAVLKKAVT